EGSRRRFLPGLPPRSSKRLVARPATGEARATAPRLVASRRGPLVVESAHANRLVGARGPRDQRLWRDAVRRPSPPPTAARQGEPVQTAAPASGRSHPPPPRRDARLARRTRLLDDPRDRLRRRLPGPRP